MDVQVLALPMEVVVGDAVTYTLDLPFLPPSKNVIDGWPPAWRASAKRKWHQWIAMLCMEQRVPKHCEHVTLAATLWFPTRNRRDLSNYAQALWNWVPDALVRSGYLVDDSDEHVAYGPNLGVTFAYDGRALPKQFRQRTTLSITVP